MEAETTESTFSSFMDTCDSCKASKDSFLGREPKLLPCLHTLCRACVTDTTDGAGNVIGVKCPTCYQECRLNDLIENRFVTGGENNVAENNQPEVSRTCTGCEENTTATSYCQECEEFLCDQCVQAHRRVRITKDHTIQPKEAVSTLVSTLRSGERTEYCPVHRQEPLKLFCETCDRLTCRDCQLQEHKDHKYSFVNEASAHYKLFLQTLLAKLKEKRTYIENAKALINKRYGEISDKEKKVTTEIKVLAVKLITEINKRGKQLLTDLNAICGAKKTQLGHKQSEILSLSNKLDHAVRFAEFMLQHSSSSSVLHTKRTLVNQLRHVLRTRCEVPNPYHVVDIRLRYDDNFIVNQLARQGQLVVDGVPYQGPHSLRQGMQPIVGSPGANNNANGSARSGQGNFPNLSNLAPEQRLALVKRLAQLHGNRSGQQCAGSPTSTMASPHLASVATGSQRLSHYTPPAPPAQSSTVSSSGNNQLGRGAQYYGNKSPGSQGGFINLHQLQKQRLQRLQPGMQPIPQQSPTNMQNPIVIAPTSPNSNYGQPVFPSNNGSPDGHRGSPHMARTSPGSQGSHGGASPLGLLTDATMRIGSPSNLTPGAEHNISPFSQDSSSDSHKPSSSVKSELNSERPSCSFNVNNIKQEVTSPVGGPAPPGLHVGELSFDDDPLTFLENIKKESLQIDTPHSAIVNLSMSTQESSHASAESSNPGIPFFSEGSSQSAGFEHNPALSLSGLLSSSQDDPSEDYCACCHNGGDLLCCDTCPKVWHLQCHLPSLITTPTGNWSCRLCKPDDEVRVDASEPTAEPVVANSKRKQPVGMSDRVLLACERVLLELFCHENSIPFHEPVSKTVPNYYKIITRPMDFLTIKSKLSRSHFNHYQTIEDFVSDVKLVFYNCAQYNQAESEVAKSGKMVEKFFEDLMQRFLPFFDVNSVVITYESSEKHKPKRKKRADDSERKKSLEDPEKKRNDEGEKKKEEPQRRKTLDETEKKNSEDPPLVAPSVDKDLPVNDGTEGSTASTETPSADQETSDKPEERKSSPPLNV